MRGSSILGKLNRNWLKDAFRQTQGDQDQFESSDLTDGSEPDPAPSSNYPFDYSAKSVRFALAEGQRLAVLGPEASASSGSALVQTIAHQLSRGKSTEEKRKERLEMLLRLALIEQIRKRLDEIEQELGKQRERLKDLDDIISRIAHSDISFENGLSAWDRVALEKAGVNVPEMEEVAGTLKHLKKHDWDYNSLNQAQKDKLHTYGVFENNLGQIVNRSGGDIDRIMAGVIDRTYAEEVRQNIKNLEAEQKALTNRLSDIEQGRNNDWTSDPVLKDIIIRNLDINTTAPSAEQQQKLEDIIRNHIHKNDRQISKYANSQDLDIITRPPLEQYVKLPEDVEVHEFYRKLAETKDFPEKEKLQKEFELTSHLSKAARTVLGTDSSIKELLNLERYQTLFVDPQKPVETTPAIIQPDGKIDLRSLGINN